MPKPRDAGVYETPMPDDFKIVGDDWAPLDGTGRIPFAGYDKNFAPGSNPDNPQDMPKDAPEPLPAETVLRIKKGCDALGLDVVAFAWQIQKAAWKTLVAATEAMPADCPTPEGCRPNGCHGACLPQSEPTKPDMRKNFEEWARDAAGLDTSHRASDSPLDRAQYERSDTALAWEAWAAATYETWSILMNESSRREVERAAARCAIPLPVMRTDASNVIAYKFQAPDGSYWYIKADDQRTLAYWRDKRKLIPLTDDKARIAAGVVVERPNAKLNGGP